MRAGYAEAPNRTAEEQAAITQSYDYDTNALYIKFSGGCLRVAGMIGQAGVADPGDSRLIGEAAGQPGGAALSLVQPQGQGAQAAQDEEGFPARRDAPPDATVKQLSRA